MKTLAYLAVLSGCVDTTFDGEPRAHVVAITGVDPETGGGVYELRTVDLPALTSFAPLTDPTLTFIDRPVLDADDPDAARMRASLLASSRFDARIAIEDGVAMPRDFRSLVVLSSYTALRDAIDAAPALTGRTLDDLLPQTGFPVAVEPELVSEFATVTMSMNAFYSPYGPFFGLVRSDDVEQLPMASSAGVIAHEFGHHLFAQSFARADGECDETATSIGPAFPGRFGLSSAGRGLNEGYADFVAWATHGTTNVLVDVLPAYAPVRAIDVTRAFAHPFTYDDIVVALECRGFYCIGTLFARALLATYRATGALDDDETARRAFAATVFNALAETPTRARAFELPPISPHEADCAAGSDDVFGGDPLLPPLLGAFVAAMPAAHQPTLCAELARHFGTTGFPAAVRGACP